MATDQSVWNAPRDMPIEGEIPRIGIVTSDWNQEITSSLLEASLAQLHQSGLSDDHILQLAVPGAFELPYGCKRIQSLHSDLDAVIAIGCVIKGDTRHDQYINQTVTSALMQLSLVGNVPIILGLLTVENSDQAFARAGGVHGNKGYEWAASALRMSSLKKQGTKRKIGF